MLWLPLQTPDLEANLALFAWLERIFHASPGQKCSMFVASESLRAAEKWAQWAQWAQHESPKF